jgi:hypothetical protein
MLSPPRLTPATHLLILSSVACFIIIVLDRVGAFPLLRQTTTLLYSWVVILAAFALILGVYSVLYLHARRIYSGQRDWPASIALVAMLAAVVVAGLADARGVFSPTMEWLFTYVIAPGQGALFALLAFFLAASAYRFLRVGTPSGNWMLLGALLVLLGQMPLMTRLLWSPLGLAVRWWLTEPIMATLRGAILGGALALVLIGVRFLLGRPQA